MLWEWSISSIFQLFTVWFMSNVLVFLGDTYVNSSIFSVDATNSNGLGRMANDAVGKGENAKMKVIKHEKSTFLCLFAKRDIKGGDEIRYDYGVKDLPWRAKTKDTENVLHEEVQQINVMPSVEVNKEIQTPGNPVELSSTDGHEEMTTLENPVELS